MARGSHSRGEWKHVSPGFTIPTEPADRRKFLIVLGIIVVCAIWMIYYFASQVSFQGVAKAPDTPGWKVANEINSKLIAEHAFADVALAVVNEKPLKLTAVGAVYSQKDRDRLPEVLKELNSEAEFEINVEIIKR